MKFSRIESALDRIVPAFLLTLSFVAAFATAGLSA